MHKIAQYKTTRQKHREKTQWVSILHYLLHYVHQLTLFFFDIHVNIVARMRLVRF
jgi:hypothetical protein